MFDVFNVTSGKLMVADPCYGKDTVETNELSNLLENARNGKWISSIVESKDNYVVELNVVHSDYEDKSALISWEVVQDVAVDSGQMGVYDANFLDITRAEDYDAICELTNPVGVTSYGVFSSSGFGDGLYTCLVGKNASNEVVSVRIIFIENEEDEDYDDGDFVFEDEEQEEDEEDNYMDDEDEYPGDPD